MQEDNQPAARNLPIDFQQLIDDDLTDEWRDGDRVLKFSEFQDRDFDSIFLKCLSSRKLKPAGKRPVTNPFSQIPGSAVLRKCTAGRVLCKARQGGATAFYVLTGEDAAAIGLEPVQGVAQETREVGTVYLPTRRNQPRKRSWKDRFRFFTGKRNADERNRPGRFIPVDGASYVDSSTRTSPLFEGELTGVMSCLTRSPRSATIQMTTDCYVIEVTRRVFEEIHTDAEFTCWAESVYREQILESYLREDIPLFHNLEPATYAKLKQEAEFEYFQPGQIIFDEHESPSDSFYVVRQGVIKVIKGARWLLGPDAWTNDIAVRTCREILDARSLEVCDVFWELLCAETQAAVRECAAGDLTSGENVRLGLNVFLRNTDFTMQAAWCHYREAQNKSGPLKENDHGKLRKAHALNAIQVQESQFHRFGQDTNSRLEDKIIEWSDAECRMFNRLFLEAICPQGIPRRAESDGEWKTLRYMGKGEFFGEMGAIRNDPRSSTCIAYDHPDLDQKKTDVTSVHRVELVRFSADLLQRVLAESAAFRQQVEKRIADIEGDDRVSDTKPVKDLARRLDANPVFDQLGLVQGQRQMLIDLEKCTRCGECVDACVESHDDGRARLFLEGPRIENWLVPLTCRNCLDPVCMVGCPVGAIQRARDGEILIQDWCIGCKICADNCPYNAIQMHVLDQPREMTEAQKEIAEGAELAKRMDLFAVVCDNCSSHPNRPGEAACVYSCPHDAAIRVDSRQFFFRED